ncbi:MAG: TIGR00282 family metallophosphoesterase [Synergistaceae bacterium]|nr:TIGR00282 family metallophosphoesterase [Synergistota bacterium]NLM70688.1 TIGR00282 family metallophosphoesterase [Synergistaceae bacterium]
MKILFIGDIIGRPGRKVVAEVLPRLAEREGGFDFVLANCENAAAGKGITRKVADELFAAGISGLTSGNHIWDKPEGIQFMAEEPRVVRPANYPDACPGQGWMTLEKGDRKLVVANLIGRVFMAPLDCPFRKADEIVAAAGDLPVFVDFHAEATSEKRALGYYLDGRVAAFVGTHTHVQTADEEILPGGTAFITDAGMTGGHRSSIGVKLEGVISRYLTGMPAKYEVSSDGLALNGVIITLDDETGRATGITRVFERLSF